MNNRYGLPLTKPSIQTILPAMTEDGVVHGWYPITQTTFTGGETSFTLPDCTVPLKTVTVDSDSVVKQFVAAVWPKGLRWNYFPWASSSLVAGDDGYFRNWSLPTSTWVLHYGKGVFLDGITSSLNRPGTAVPTPPGAPTVSTPKSLNWQASVAAMMFTGDCKFFDFNWVTLFTSTGETVPLRIEVLTNPPPIAPATTAPLLAKVVGIPTAVNGGVLYDSVRILKNQESIPTGTYVFTFKIYNTSGLAANVTLNLTIT
jgi:hypothetical protein